MGQTYIGGINVPYNGGQEEGVLYRWKECSLQWGPEERTWLILVGKNVPYNGGQKEEMAYIGGKNVIYPEREKKDRGLG